MEGKQEIKITIEKKDGFVVIEFLDVTNNQLLTRRSLKESLMAEFGEALPGSIDEILHEELGLVMDLLLKSIDYTQ